MTEAADPSRGSEAGHRAGLRERSVKPSFYPPGERRKTGPFAAADGEDGR